MSPQKPQTRQPSPTPSTQSTLLGVIVLAFGIACLLGVGTWAWFKIGGHKNNLGSEATTQSPQNSASQDTHSPQHAKNLVKPTAKELLGAWKTNINGGVATIVFVKDAFRIIYASDKEGRLREYSSGHYTYDKKSGILRLMPSRRFAEPEPIPDVQYKILTLRYFDILALKEENKDEILWVPPEDQLAGKRTHPLFFYIGGNKTPIVRWTKAQ